jgi:hypothetical protein
VKVFDASQLTQFTGTEKYYRLTSKFLLTDGTKYLADKAECYWVMDAAASHLLELGIVDWFVLVRLEVQGTSAVMYYEDGNGNEHARQQIPYTAFPLTSVTLYACWDGEHWVIMLPTEY